MKQNVPASTITPQRNQWHRIRYAYHEAGHAASAIYPLLPIRTEDTRDIALLMPFMRICRACRSGEIGARTRSVRRSWTPEPSHSKCCARLAAGTTNVGAELIELTLTRSPSGRLRWVSPTKTSWRCSGDASSRHRISSPCTGKW